MRRSAMPRRLERPLPAGPRPAYLLLAGESRVQVRQVARGVGRALVLRTRRLAVGAGLALLQPAVQRAGDAVGNEQPVLHREAEHAVVAALEADPPLLGDVEHDLVALR